MADDRKILQKIASYLPWPIAGAVKESQELRGRVEGTIPNKMDVAAGIEEPPKSEGKSNYEGTPRQKFYK